MTYLLDTHAFLWYIYNQPQLSKSAASILKNTNHTFLLSMASVWEMVIKQTNGKLDIEHPAVEVVDFHLSNVRLQLANITLDHLHRLSSLPYIHKDPFDRILIAQSLCEELPILSKDSMFKKYGANVIW